MQSVEGKTVVFWSIPAIAENPPFENTHISGLFTVDEHVPYEPAAYVHTPGFNVVDNNTGEAFFVEEDIFWEQVNPKGHGRMILQEREWQFYHEDVENRIPR